MKRYKDALKSGLYTALWTFIFLFGTSLLGWLQDWAELLTDENATVVFADPAVLVKAALSAGVAAGTGLVGGLVRLAQANTSLPGSPPSYPQHEVDKAA